MFAARADAAGRWRIIRLENGYEADVCGAISLPVALAQCEILNARGRGK